MPRHNREPGLLPRPLAVLGALALAAGTAAAVRLLPADAAPPPRPPAARPSATPVPTPLPERAAGFVRFVDTAREPAFDLPAQARRTGVRRYALGHLVAGGDGCSPRWSGPQHADWTLTADHTPDPEADHPPDPEDGHLGDPEDDRTTHSEPGDDRTGARVPEGPAEPGDRGRGGLLDPARNPVAGRIGELRALGGEVAPVFGGPGGQELAATCTKPGGLAAAYRRVVGAFDAAAVDFEVRDSADRAAVLRRARAIHALQRVRRLKVSFTLRLRRDGLAPGDVAMLRATQEAGAEVGTVNLLAPLEPRGTRGARLGLVAASMRAAAGQVARAQRLAEPGAAWRRLALTPVLAGAGDLSAHDARTLAGYAARHGLAWLSLRGVIPDPHVSRILWRGSP
ncbi:Chitinase [[Actinomadura] parvosata subsp. kistnae]|uniref:Chitinase n=1 Tax=[Actinomadura] parvosata subsp. kistnae TaxID=1909395 RepID=A0A1U9ZQM8_9ACTN|nr:hypothetical protein [Nonomuraea sp. ATCC 55076]AQZ60247.1 hypothetical protein BKM31_00825 [Nonomuraea sp. ATCC 55076]SPL91263.1 Chitinase [Actinomadura parvosata subsp. kistnae]